MSKRPLQTLLSRSRSIVMLEADSREFSAELQRAFPTIRFRERDYWLQRHFSKVKGEAFQQPPDLRIPYLPDLVSASRWISVGWIEQPHWQPDWRPYPPSIDDHGQPLHRIVNEPPLSFEYYAEPLRQPEQYDLRDGDIAGKYERGNAEQKAFLAKVWRILETFTTNRFVMVYDDTGRVRDPLRASRVWAGRHALAWCAERPERRIAHCLRPLDAPPALPIPKSEWRAAYCERRENGSDFATIETMLQDYRLKSPQKEAEARRILYGEEWDDAKVPATKASRVRRPSG